MGKIIKSTAFLSVIIALLNACSFEQELDDSPALQAGNKITIKASFPEKTKISLSEGGDALDLVWDKSDYLTIVSGGVSERFDMVSFDGNVAEFSGYKIDGESYDILLSCSGDEFLSRRYDGQMQTTVSSIDHLKYDAVLKGVSQCTDVSFTNGWAEAHGGELLQNGCLLLYFQMPDDAGYLKSVTLSASSDIFYVTNAADGGRTDAVTLLLDDADMAADNVVKAHIMTSMQETEIPSDEELTLTVVSNLGTWSKAFTPGASVIGAGKRSVIKLNAENWVVPSGDGTEANPYILRTAADLKNMSSKLGEELKYVAMVADIDAASITEWPSISYNKLLDFNGNNRTISNFKPTFKNDYAGLVGILNGRIANLNIKGAEITGNADKASGILCGYLGRNNASAFGEIENVHVEGSISGTGKGTGGLVGVIGSGKISRSSANVNVHSTKDDVGGLVGYYRDGSTDNICEISNCWTSGTVTGDTQKVGGIMGETYGNADDELENTNAVLIENCYSTASVKGVRNVAGIVAYTFDKELTSVKNCIAWNKSIEATGTKLTQHSSGAVVGKTYTLHTLYDCYRKPEIVFNCIIYDKNGEDEVIDAKVCDQENADSSNKLVVGTYGEAGSEYKTEGCSSWYPYHGKAASAGSTVSSVAKSLGWDETVWDLSGDQPSLIR